MIGGITMLMEPAADKACLACGYDLRAGTGDRCPECGGWFDVTGELTPTLPWAHRRRVGRVRGYLKTVNLLKLKHRRLGEELGRVVDAKGARSFRRITVLIAFLTLGVSAYFARMVWERSVGGEIRVGSRPWFSQIGSGDVWLGDVTALLIWKRSFWVSLFALFLILFAITGSVRWFVLSRGMDKVRWNRAAGLAEYMCAPLALLPVALSISWGLFALLGGVTNPRPVFEEWEPLVMIGILPGLVIGHWLGLTFTLIRRARGAGILRTTAVMILMLITWSAIALTIFFSVHAVSTFVILLFQRS